MWAGNAATAIARVVSGLSFQRHRAAGDLAAQRGGEFISIFYGEGVQAGEAEGAQAKFEAACPEAEITTLEGGQPVYHYLISVE